MTLHTNNGKMSSSDEEHAAHESPHYSDSSDENETLASKDNGETCNQELRKSIADELKEGKEVAKKLDNMLLDAVSQRKCDKLVVCFEWSFENLVKIFYEDITPSLSNGTPFIVDGDMLLINAMADVNYNKSLGGQMLHLIYLCERRLQFFVQKDGVFQVVFFKNWSWVWKQFPEIQLARTVLLNHFKHNLKYNVYEFSSVWDLNFKQHLDTYRPPFVLMDLDIDHYPKSLSVYLVLHAQVLITLSSSVLCIDLNYLKLDISTLIAFNATPKLALKIVLLKNLRKVSEWIDSFFLESTDEPDFLLQNDFSSISTLSLQKSVAISTAAALLKEPNVHHDLIRIYLACCAVKNLLALSSRGFCGVQNIPEELSTFVCVLHKKMNIALCEAVNGGVDLVHIADIWQGNLFSFVLITLSACDTTKTSEVWSDQLSDFYGELILETCQLANTSLAAFPVVREPANWLSRLELTDSEPEVRIDHGGGNSFFPLSCNVVEQFCHDCLQPVKFTESEITEMKHYQEKNSKFDEIRHFHSRRPLTDEVDRTPDSWKYGKSFDPWEQRRIDRTNQLYIRFLETYGMNMEGNVLNPKPIVCVQNQNSNDRQKKQKVSKKAQAIINAKKEADTKLKEAAEMERVKSFSLQFKNMMITSKYSQALVMIEELLRKLEMQQLKCTILISKAKVYHELWSEVCNSGNKNDLTYIKELFLTVKAVLQLLRDKQVALPISDLKNIGKWLVELGFDEVARKNGLPIPNHARTDLTIGMSWVEFQLEHLGPELDRTIDGVPDRRVEGFIPDKWQRELFDIVDKKQSALVVAPTSSGKTYASYYCMESVLRESNDGIVVYVSPTKALVNQVHATVYARFKNKQMPPGKAVCGVFTRDYQFRSMECQILVTVPQCLELLLLSARRHDWACRLRYVILDEIHCLAGQAGGIAWERCLLMIRCPFLALSATVGHPERFHRWLLHVEDFKAARDAADGISRPQESYRVKLVKHAERHADLIKYIYSEGEFKHLHPYALVDVTVAEHGIPYHVTLSPSEILQLYKVMCSVESELEIPEPDIYFSSSETGFLTRSGIKYYKHQLKAKLEMWARKDPAKYQLVHTHLRCGLRLPAESAAKEEVIEDCTELAMTLKANEMLPALVFSYNRDLIEVACFTLAEDCKKLVVTKVARKQTKFEEREQRKALEKLENIPKDFKNQSLKLLEGQGYFRNVGTVDSQDLKFLENRLRYKAGLKSDSEFIEVLRQGISYHHGGLSAVKRSAVEMMFRLKVLNLVYATGTLALGIHMPCRTVVLAGDSHFINSLEYHQMSGRAGRRGYDISGNVVFMGIGHRKMKTLVTDNFPVMKGNFPLSVGTVLRVLLLVARVTSKGAQDPAVTQDALSRVLTLLNCSMVYQERPEMIQQMKYFFAFSTVLLMLQGFIDVHGSPQMLSSIVTHLHYHEPGNLAFVFLFRTGALRELCRVERNGAISKQTQLDVVLVLSYLFAHMPLHNTLKNVQPKNSKVRLPPLPKHIRKTLEAHNQQVKFVFNKFFQSVSLHCEKTMGPDNKLPLSGIDFTSPFVIEELQENTLEGMLAARSGKRTICSTFAALSGNKDDNLYNETQLVSNIRHQVFTDMKVVPLVDVDETLNGYAWDFYNHGIVSAIRNDNKLKTGTDFEKLKDFSLVLKAITVTLEELEPRHTRDPVVRTFRLVTDTFADRVRKGFGGGA